MISVIIPMYNSESTIEKALNSVKNQTAIDFIKEIIVVNDGSTDNSLEIVKKYCDRNKYLNIKIINKVNGGVSSARNVGLSIASGEYIALLDSDDEWLIDKIEIQMKIMSENKNIKLSATTLNNQKIKRFFLKKFDYITYIKPIDLVFKNYFQPSTVIFLSSSLERVGYFPEDQRYAEEGNFFMRFSNEFDCILINESYLNFGSGKSGFGESGLSANLREMQKGELKNIKFAKNQGYISYLIYMLAFIFSNIKYVRRIILTNMRWMHFGKKRILGN